MTKSKPSCPYMLLPSSAVLKSHIRHACLPCSAKRIWLMPPPLPPQQQAPRRSPLPVCLRPHLWEPCLHLPQASGQLRLWALTTAPLPPPQQQRLAPTTPQAPQRVHYDEIMSCPLPTRVQHIVVIYSYICCGHALQSQQVN